MIPLDILIFASSVLVCIYCSATISCVKKVWDVKRDNKYIPWFTAALQMVSTI